MEDPKLNDYKKARASSNVPSELLRIKIREHAKGFKTSWVNLGQALYSVWRDKLYYAWGYDKFEYYTEQEIGLPRQMSMKLLRNYCFVEQEEPDYLKKGFCENRPAVEVPGYEAVDVLRLAKKKKELNGSDYVRLKRDIFEKGKDASSLRQNLAQLIRERKKVDPLKEREQRSALAIRKLCHALEFFSREMEALKTVPNEIIIQSHDLFSKLEKQL